MSKKNHRGAQVLAWIKSNPGSLAREIGRGVGYDHKNGLLSYMTKQGMIFKSGPKHWQRYYLTLDDAVSNHARIEAEAKAERQAKLQNAWRESTLRRRAKLAAAGGRLAHKNRLPDGVTLSPGINVIVAQRAKDRFAVESPTPYFSALAIGSYPPSDSALARAWGMRA